jgi:hypothetical protein
MLGSGCNLLLVKAGKLVKFSAIRERRMFYLEKIISHMGAFLAKTIAVNNLL